MSEATTWDTFVDYLRSAGGRLRAAEHGASEMLLLGPGDAGANQSAALRRLVEGSRAAVGDLSYALERIEEFRTPARPLEAVLTDIVAQGHYYEIYGPGYIGRDEASVYTRRLGTDGFKGEGVDEHRRWVEDVEGGEARAATVAAAAETRLAQIRAQHAEKLERDGLEADVPPQVIHRAMDELAAEERQRETQRSEEGSE